MGKWLEEIDLLQKLAVNNVLTSDRVGSGLKADIGHRSASYLSTQLEAEMCLNLQEVTVYEPITNERRARWCKGIFEYIIDRSNKITHQRFIKEELLMEFQIKKSLKNK